MLALLLTQELDTPGAVKALLAIATAMSSFIRQLSHELIDSFTNPIYLLAAAAACLAIMASLTKTIYDEQQQGAKPLLEWFARLSLGAFLLISMTGLIKVMDAGRKEVTELSTPIVETARTRFDESYQKFVETRFLTAKDEGEQSAPIWDSDKPWYQNADRMLDPNQWSPTRLYAAITIARSLLISSEMVAKLIWAVVLLVMTLVAPFMAAVIVDKQLARKLTSPYAWALLVTYFIWPIVADILSSAGYSMATVTIEAFTNPGASPQANAQSIGYAVSACVIITLVAALMQFGSLGIAYRISKGQVFESVGAAAFNWIGSLAGTAIEYFGIRASADMEMLGRISEIEGGYRASIVVAKSNRDASMLQAAAGKEGGTLTAQASLTAQSYMAQARRQLSLDNNIAIRDSSVPLINNSTSLKLNEIETSRTARIGEISANLGRELQELSIERDSAKRRNIANTAATTYTIGSNLVQEEIKKALLAVVTGGASAAVAEVAEAEAAASTEAETIAADSSEAVNATYGSTQLDPSVTQVKSIDLPGISNGKLIGEQPLSGDSIRSETLDDKEIRRDADKGNTEGSLVATLALGAFNLYNTNRVAGEHIHNVEAYTTRITDIINERADKMSGFLKEANTAAVSIYDARHEALAAAQTTAAATKIEGTHRLYELQRQSAAAVYNLLTESADRKHDGQTSAAEIHRDSSLESAAAKREAVLLRELTKDFSRRANSNALRL